MFFYFLNSGKAIQKDIHRYKDKKMEKFKRFIADKFSFNDYLHVSSEFAKDEETGEFKNLLTNDWENTSYSGNDKERLGKILQKLHAQIKPVRKIEKIRERFMRVAVVLLLPALITIGALSYLLIEKTNTAEAWAEIHSPVGTRTRFQLPDGSKGWLNSGSTIKYPVSFSKRQVEVTGEALFDVTHKNSSEFRVITPYFDVKVLGTRFDIIAYENDETAEVILERGKVQVLDKSNKLKSELAPDEHFVYNKNTKQSIKKAIDSGSYINWTEGVLIFKNEPMSEIVRRLGRKYNADIILGDEALKSLVFRATFQDESLDEICKMLSEVAPIEYKIYKRERLSDDTFTKGKVEIRQRN